MKRWQIILSAITIFFIGRYSVDDESSSAPAYHNGYIDGVNKVRSCLEEQPTITYRGDEYILDDDC